jgi:hypothetical protein
MYKTTEELNAESRIRNDEKLDECCKTVCIVFGWGLVVTLIVYSLTIFAESL